MTFRRRSIPLFFICIAAQVIFLGTPAALSEAQSGLRGFSAAHVDAERQLEQSLRKIPDAQHAEENLKRITLEPHMAGTEASHRLAEWLRLQYESFGFDAKLVSYSVWLPQPTEIKLELIAPQRKSLGTQEEAYEWDKSTYDARASVGFNTYSPSGDVTAPIVYANYGTADDYRQLESLGASVAGKIVLVRYGSSYRGIKAKLAEEHKAAGLLIYSDPADDGYDAGDIYPTGPWRPMSGIQRGSILYTEIYPGDPLTPGIAATIDAPRIAPSEARSLPRIPVMPINAQDAAVILSHLTGAKVPRAWQGGLPITYHAGPGESSVHFKIAMDYQQRKIYDVIARLPGADDSEWVVLGNHHDAWVFGAVDPGSGTAVMLETARALGELVRGGWKPRRSIVMCEWDGEEPGLIGSTEWVEENVKELQAKAVAYINTDVGVAGPNFAASATPSLQEIVREVTREVTDPKTGHSVYDSWKEHNEHSVVEANGTPRDQTLRANNDVPLGTLGAGSDFCPFFDFAGIPSLDLGFSGDYGVYHSLYDDFFWMKRFGDPDFTYHAALAKILGTLVLRLDQADVLPFDYFQYAETIQHEGGVLAASAKRAGLSEADVAPLTDSAAQFREAAERAAPALRSLESSPANALQEQQVNLLLASVEQAFLSAQGLPGRPWYKHMLWAPGSYAGYSAVMMPSLSEAIERKDMAAMRREIGEVAAALSRAAARLNEISRLVQPGAMAHAKASEISHFRRLS
jgi:N-acetylated-alpha-linked acidic dipeptidase